MNLRQIILSRWKTVSSRWNTHKKFTSKPLGSIISLNFDGNYNAGTKTWRFDMSIMAATQVYESITLYDNPSIREGKKRNRDKFYAEPKEKIKTHTCTIIFKDIEEVKLNLREIEEREDLNYYTVGNLKRRYSDLKVEQDVRRAKATETQRIIDKYKVVVVSTKEEEAKTGIRVFRTPISLQSQVNVRCTCGNFYYAFAWYNADNNCLVGERPPMYLPYDSQSMTVSALNENGNPGICKHLELLIATLLDQDIIGTNNYNDRFIGSLSPSKFVQKQLNHYKELTQKVLERREDKAEEELTNFLKKLRLKALEVRMYRNSKKDK